MENKGIQLGLVIALVITQGPERGTGAQSGGASGTALTGSTRVKERKGPALFERSVVVALSGVCSDA
jgi:hypothetical protein